MQDEAADAQIARDGPVGPGIADLHAPAAAAAARQALQQRGAFAGGAAALAARSHVARQPLAGLQILRPGDIARMVLGQADRPLVHRHLAIVDLQPSGLVEALLAALAAEHERACIRGVSQEVMHGSIARPCPPNPSVPDRPARQQLLLGDQLKGDLARRSEPPPEHEDTLDRVPDLLVGAEHDAAVFVAVEPDRQRQLQLATGSLVTQPAVQAGADQVQLGLRHRALQPQQEPIVELARRIHAVGVGDQRARQRAQVQQLMPVRRRARQPRRLQRQDQPDVTEADVGDELFEAEPPVTGSAGTAEVLVDDHHRLGRPAKFNGPLAQRILPRG
jgi:hypothetical protein